ncbi:PaaX family transcriptional regulator C-terminal domain-containing protein [Nonomuraea basaltis]|uniref:PaaX family transcriptional regulator C-terminal domain-containing protein n=1 Tax=Nonomuraea basaltis TaxID=2495887 RepID=UPI00110C440E|nr:PaaX family transcriptional regulator C-terminal domain-containing protein [Nonomuraea basaltis]TMR90005.1 PaaX domain-containing protein, C- domain protein [Nonomuraea basaltis]
MPTKGSPPAEAGLRPLSTRSVVLSLLLGSHPPQMPVRELVRVVEPFGISSATLRVALTRMVASGDLRRLDSTYRLSDRLLERQRRQDAALDPRTRAWDGDWEIVVITATGRGAAERAQLRADLAALRLAELREGVWTRPANLVRSWPGHLAPLVQRWTGRPDQPAAELAETLWDLQSWAGTGHALLSACTGADRPADRFAVIAAMFRHLLTDPVLPGPLLPPDWPAPALRAAHAGYQDQLTGRARIAT